MGMPAITGTPQETDVFTLRPLPDASRMSTAISKSDAIVRDTLFMHAV
jgi:hypothetical protein